MLRALVIAVLLATVPAGTSGQTSSVLRIKVTLTDAAGTPIPIPRHALLISEDPVSAAPRRVVTGSDGAVDVTLLPGRYTVESDQPVAFAGKGYGWTQHVVLTAGRTVVLNLTGDNADAGVVPAPATAAPAPATLPADAASLLLSNWTGSVVAIWTPRSRASGFVIDASGLVVTNQRAVGTASIAEVQLTPALKVRARVLVADRTRDVAVLQIDPAVLGSVRPLRIDCAAGSRPTFTNGQELLAIQAPIRGPYEVSAGEIVSVERPAPVADFSFAPGGAGGPVFSSAGTLVGVSSLVDDGDQGSGRAARVIPIGDACAVLSEAQNAVPAGTAPTAARLPVELSKPFAAGALESAVRSRGGLVSPYAMSTSDFDIAFLTPVVIYSAQHAPARTSGRGG
jgi:S1-C subfamily serine protease